MFDACDWILRLHAYSEDTAVAVIADADISFKINTEHLRDLSFRIGSYYQFIGELHILPEDVVCDLLELVIIYGTLKLILWHNFIFYIQAILQARVGRIVDGLDLNLYNQSLQLRRRFESELVNSRVTWVLLSETSNNEIVTLAEDVMMLVKEVYKIVVLVFYVQLHDFSMDVSLDRIFYSLIYISFDFVSLLPMYSKAIEVQNLCPEVYHQETN